MTVNRTMGSRLRQKLSRKTGRLLVLTGARQTGKTTLVKALFPELPYLSLEDPASRPAFSRMSAAEWIERYPEAILDEVQKVPTVIESIKAAYDASPRVRYLLLGSSQILLLSKVNESLAGRVSILELWPLTLPEMATVGWDDPVAESRFVHWLRSSTRSTTTFRGIPAGSRTYARYLTLFDRYLHLGGMPALLDPELSADEKSEWLLNYRRTYLERDVTDLAALRDLEPFVVAQKAAAARSGKLVNFSELARLAQVNPQTARRFLRYLELSYQVLLLPPYFRNVEKRLVRMPKVHFLDPGVLRAVQNRRGEPTGEEFESAVVAEVYKQLKNAGLAADFYHLRTHDGREVDLLLELDEGFVAIEVKQAHRVAPPDARSLKGLGTILDKPLLASFVLSLDPEVKELGEGILAMPVPWAFGTAAEGD